MGTVTYIAKRSLLPTHSINDTYSLDIGLVEAVKTRRVEKSQPRSKGGNIETLYHRADVEWSLTFAPVRGYELAQLLEFLDSTESGDVFTVDIYGTAAAPIAMKRTDEGYTLQPFMRVGSEDGDWFQASAIAAVET